MKKVSGYTFIFESISLISAVEPKLTICFEINQIKTSSIV